MFALLLLPLMASCVKDTAQVTWDSLLDEMISVEESARYPLVPYHCLQVSSYDRSSVSSDSPGWFANNDGYGIVRTDTVDGRIERVMFDEEGPGTITRIWITTVDKRGTWRFYFDGESTPGWIVPAYDLMQFGIPELEARPRRRCGRPESRQRGGPGFSVASRGAALYLVEHLGEVIGVGEAGPYGCLGHGQLSLQHIGNTLFNAVF